MRACAALAATLLFGLPSSAAAATAVEALHARLAGLVPEGTVRARIDVRSESRSSEEQGTSSGAESVVAELGPEGLRLLWTLEQLAAARDGAWFALRNPDAPYAGASLGQVPPDEATNFLDHADRLLRVLEGAKVVEQRPDASRGAGGQLMRLTPARRMSAASAKMVKSYEDELRIWLDRDGWPVATERKTKVRASKMFVSFGSETKVTRELRLVAGRLVVTSERYESAGDGMGTEGSGTTISTVTILP